MSNAAKSRSFSQQIERWTQKVQARGREVFLGVANLCKDSITDGSMLTGAPGQPVDTGHLKASWTLRFPSQGTAVISTNVIYAPGIEDGLGPYGKIQLRSLVGGFHSVKLTAANYDKVVRFVVSEVVFREWKAL